MRRRRPRSRSPRRVHASREPGITVHRSSPDRPGRTHGAHVPVTSVARTLVDLADVLSERAAARAVDQAEEPARLRPGARSSAVAGAGARPPRAARLRRVLAAYLPEPHFLRSEAERRLKRLCRDHGLPQPAVQRRVAGYELDAYWPEARLALEFDGAATHHTRHGRSTRTAAATARSRREGIADAAGHLARPGRRRCDGARSLGDPAPAASLERSCPSSRSTPPTRPSPTSRRRATALAEGIDGGRPLPDAARRHRRGQDGDDGVHDRAGPAPRARDRPQQDAGRPALQRVPRVLPGQRGRVLRLLLRLLPARGLRPELGPLHREGLLDQPGDRAPAPRGHGVRCSGAAT